MTQTSCLALRRISHDRCALGRSLYAIIGFFYTNSYMVVGQPGRLVYADGFT